MKQIPFYQGIKKKVIVKGPSIIPNQTYKCAVFSSLTDPSTTIFTTAIATVAPLPPSAPADAPTIGTVTFNFSTFQTKVLNLGDNNLAVYDVLDNDPTTSDDEYSMYRVYEARVLAADSIANHEEVFDLELIVDGSDYWIMGGNFIEGYLLLKDKNISASGDDIYIKAG